MNNKLDYRSKETAIYEDKVNQGVVRVTEVAGGQITEEPCGLTSQVQAIIRQVAHELHGREQVASLVIMAPPLLSRQGWGHDLIIGYGFMRHYVVTFD